MATADEFPCSIRIDIPLPTHRLATTALKALQVDKELSPLVQRTLSVVATDNASQGAEETLLRAEYKATTNRMLRVSTNGFMESLKLVLEVMETLDTDVLAST